MSETIYDKLFDEMVWSYSRIGCFENCPYSFYLKYLYGLTEPKVNHFYASYGTYVHKLIEQYYNGEISKENLEQEFKSRFIEEVEGTPQRQSTVLKYFDAGVEYFRNFEEFPYRPLAVEKKVEFKISGISFVGIVDFIGEKDGEIYIVDNKSHDLKPRSTRSTPTKNDLELDKMLRQLYLYSLGVYQEYGRYPKALCFNCFKNKQFIIEEFDNKKFDEVIAWAETMISLIREQEIFYPNMDYFYCNYLCDVCNQCEYVETGDKK